MRCSTVGWSGELTQAASRSARSWDGQRAVPDVYDLAGEIDPRSHEVCLVAAVSGEIYHAPTVQKNFVGAATCPACLPISRQAE